MSKRKKLLFIILFVGIDILLIYGFVRVHNATMLNYLKKEVSILENKKISKDSYSYKIVTMGGYAKVEEAIKKYLYDYSNLLKDTMEIVKDSSIKKVLSYENYQKDGPDFSKSFSLLKEKKEKFNKNVDQLIQSSSKKSIQNNIRNKIYQSYYQKLYDELFVNDSFVKSFDDTSKLLESIKVKMNTIFDTSLEVLNFLSSEKENWKVEDGEIKFQTQALYDQYMSYINRLKV